VLFKASMLEANLGFLKNHLLVTQHDAR